MSTSHDLRVQVRGTGPDVERAERVIRSALTAAGFHHVSPKPGAERRHLHAVPDDEGA